MMSKKNLSTKILLMVEGILLISSILFCTVSVYRARIGIRRAIQQRMLDIANCASGSVNGDVLESLTAADTGSAEYEKIYDTASAPSLRSRSRRESRTMRRWGITGSASRSTCARPSPIGRPSARRRPAC